MSTGSFSEDPETSWDSEPQNRTMTLLKHFHFIDPAGEQWDAPEGSSIDGASIPQFLWSTVGSPYTGPYRRASIVHDVACDAAGTDHAQRLAADKMFFFACRTGGCSVWEAIILYVGVRFGAWMSGAGLVEDQGIKIERNPVERDLQEDFRRVCELVLRQGETENPDVIESRTVVAMQKVLTARLALPQAAAAFVSSSRT